MDKLQIIRNFIVSELCADTIEVGDTDPLIEQGIVDSSGIMSLISFLEERFSIEISGDELVPENFESIATISVLINRKIGVPVEV